MSQKTIYIKQCTQPESKAWSMKNKHNVFYVNKTGTEYFVYTTHKEDWPGVITTKIWYEGNNFEECMTEWTQLKMHLQMDHREYANQYYLLYYYTTEIKEEKYGLYMTGESHVENGKRWIAYQEIVTDKQYNKHWSHITSFDLFDRRSAAQAKLESNIKVLGLLTLRERSDLLTTRRTKRRIKDLKAQYANFNEADVLVTRQRYSRETNQGLPCHHIYFLYDGDEIVYVGQTKAKQGDPTARPRQHTDKDWDTFETFEVPRHIDLTLVEGHFIKKHNPKYNKMIPLSDKVLG